MEELVNDWPCGFCHKIFSSLEAFEGHKEEKHAYVKRANDPTDERNFGKSKGPFYLRKRLINDDPKVDMAIIEKMKSNPKVINSKCP